MKEYTYFPGCSSSAEGGARAFTSSLEAVARVLDITLKELPDWNCCGSTPTGSVDELGAFCLAARNLALAEKLGPEMVTPCSACYVVFNHTNDYLKRYPDLKGRVGEALAAGGLTYEKGVKVRHVLEVFVQDIGEEAIRAKVVKSLTGLKVAPYYGCQIVRPGFGFDHPEAPTALERLITSLGAEPTDFPLKTRCCGGSLIIPEEDIALDLMRRLLESAARGGAECLVTVCPLCQTNLDAYQGMVNRKFRTEFRMPVLFFTQLMGLAFGLGEKELGLDRCVVPPGRVLAART
ncbi:MAG: CoB--CoM heterodisulfide reductase iron-sulfur subunit B family protein [Dehalococcoidales bacterium]|nr:CoB--CoM heterodisulfide reductase iron-sulfur subunit B family protein [Dehalococcoidales bacterium]